MVKAAGRIHPAMRLLPSLPFDILVVSLLDLNISFRGHSSFSSAEVDKLVCAILAYNNANKSFLCLYFRRVILKDSFENVSLMRKVQT